MRFSSQATSADDWRLSPNARPGSHQVQRDDGCTLFGFQEKRERDLFRTLISVTVWAPRWRWPCSTAAPLMSW